MAYVRGNSGDFDRWSGNGASGWSYKDVLPYFKKSERNSRGASQLHGADGPMFVADGVDPTEAHHDFIEAAGATPLLAQALCLPVVAVFSFLLFRSFVTPQIFNQHGGGVTAGGAAASTGSEMLSNRVSDFLNAYFGNLTGISDLQLGLNYRPGSHTSTEAVDLALSKQFLNNKISVDGNFGVNNNAQLNNSGALIGDVNIDYKLSEDGRYRLKGFNRSNDNTQIATAGGPYTQGIGFFYREEFETFNELFARYLKKVRKNSGEKRPPRDAGDDR